MGLLIFIAVAVIIGAVSVGYSMGKELGKAQASITIEKGATLVYSETPPMQVINVKGGSIRFKDTGQVWHSGESFKLGPDGQVIVDEEEPFQGGSNYE